MTKCLPLASLDVTRDATLSQVAWVAEPWLAEGAITEVDGKIKIAGKTTFITHMADAIVAGNRFMGRQTRQTPVVVLTEQSRATFR